MALPVVPGVLKVVHKFLFNDTTLAVVRAYENYTGIPPLVSDLLVLGGLLGPAFTTDVAPVMSPNLQYSSVELTDLSSSTGAAIEFPFTGRPGLEVGNDLPAAACVLLDFGITRRYRGGKPKQFPPLLTGSDLLTDQTWQVASLTGATNSWIDFLDVIPLNPWPGAGVITLANVSYYEGFTAVENVITGRWRNVPKPRVTPLVDLVQSISASPQVHFQTRRGKI
jgi:hypothetical protein